MENKNISIVNIHNYMTWCE